MTTVSRPENVHPTKIPVASDGDMMISYSDAEDDSSADSGLAQGFCPLVHDSTMTDCQKIAAILAAAGIDKHVLEFCEDPEAWLAQLKRCCRDERGRPERDCLANALRILRGSVKELVVFSDLQ